jgi:3-methyladenine DNA glycosylase Tag
MQDRRLIRNRRKLEAIVANAGEMVDLERAHGSFSAYLRYLGDFDATSSDLRRRFRFLGEMGAYYFLYVVGEEVPPYDWWCAERHSHGKAHRAPRTRAVRAR